ncbi:winged helix-turn-helix transcriptional regulator [Amycolatopsis sp. lyj-112]|uniref:winged helix-turn-helix transcriptional regulator n=1 Tax=Amycolatopsis sp. lyj-112 TaxID=2789288 RepID=UPI00397C6FA9
MNDVFLADCRARLAFDLMANTWNPVVLWALKEGALRPAELRRRLGGISTKVLTETVRRLEFNGLISRRDCGRTAKVEYSLTDLGVSLLGPIEAFGEWAYRHGDDVMEARDRAARTAGEPRPA